eukprot:TRINITY_DN333_c0_g1_i3.p1 TRINITY_DN333_c0_g1~~TRINITY_DN333_c0_g1_i3.p1  ORF type:complete len:1000 (+),score=252.66 TRINITY_DN333_c0_g1_i3:111-3110(+)
MAPKTMAPKTTDVKANAKAGTNPEETKKRKAEGKEDGPAKKEAKTDDVVMVADTAGEEDAPADSRPTLPASAVVFEPMNTTVNVVPALHGKVLMALSDGGMQYLIAGARGNVAVRTGRYMFEVQIVEQLAQVEVPLNARRGPVPRQLVRVGFSSAGSDLVLGEGAGSICFDSEGTLLVDGEKKLYSTSHRFSREQVVAIVLNVDPKSPNKNTVSLFRDGGRISEPQPLPESLIGKPLFPHVAYRNLSVSVNFGPHSLKSLPFDCRMLSTAAKSDVIVAPSTVPKDGKYEVLFPISLPDQGSFDWLDSYMEERPNCVELSDRKILEWAAKSGIVRPSSARSVEGKNSNDKPEFNFGIPALDDVSARRIINVFAPVVPRNYIVMDVKANMIATEREQNLKRFNSNQYKRVARVVMGKPDEAFQERTQEVMLRAKQEKATAEWKARKVEKERKKVQEERHKQVMEMRKAADERRKKAAEEARKKTEEARKKMEDAKKAAEGAEKGEAVKEDDVGGEKGKGDGNEEEKTDDAKKAAEGVEKGEVVKEDGVDGEKGKGDGNEEEKTDDAKKAAEGVEKGEVVKEDGVDGEKGKGDGNEEERTHDASKDAAEQKEPTAEAKDEANQDESKEQTKDAVTEEAKDDVKGETKGDAKEDANEETKDVEMEEEEEPEPVVELTEEEKQVVFRPKPLPDLTVATLNSCYSQFTLPEESEGFDDIMFEWEGEDDSKDCLKKWIHQYKLTCRIDDLKPGEWFSKKKTEWEQMLKEWKEKQRTFKASEKEDDTAEKEKDKDKEVDQVDIFSVTDVCDVGNGVPLFKDFTYDDWILLQLRSELYLLVHAYVKDTEDAEIIGFPEKHFDFYYQKYFNRNLQPASFGVEKLADLLNFAKDTIKINESTNMFEAVLTEEADNLDPFVKLVEEFRRERQRRIDAGDETAKLKFASNCMAQPVPPASTSNQKWSHSSNSGGSSAWGSARPAGVQPWGNNARPQSWGWSRPATSGWQSWR